MQRSTLLVPRPKIHTRRTFVANLISDSLPEPGFTGRATLGGIDCMVWGYVPFAATTNNKLRLALAHSETDVAWLFDEAQTPTVVTADYLGLARAISASLGALAEASVVPAKPDRSSGLINLRARHDTRLPSDIRSIKVAA
jgi:hypothetical protein